MSWKNCKNIIVINDLVLWDFERSKTVTDGKTAIFLLIKISLKSIIFVITGISNSILKIPLLKTLIIFDKIIGNLEGVSNKTILLFSFFKKLNFLKIFNSWH